MTKRFSIQIIERVPAKRSVREIVLGSPDTFSRPVLNLETNEDIVAKVARLAKEK